MLSLSVYCMISRKDTYPLETINSIINANRNEFIKVFFSIKENIYLKIKNKIKDEVDNINILEYKIKYKSVFDHIRFLLNHCKSDYIIILHDDDIVGKDFFINVYQNLLKLKPEALSCGATFIDHKSNQL